MNATSPGGTLEASPLQAAAPIAAADILPAIVPGPAPDSLPVYVMAAGPALEMQPAVLLDGGWDFEQTLGAPTSLADAPPAAWLVWLKRWWWLLALLLLAAAAASSRKRRGGRR